MALMEENIRREEESRGEEEEECKLKEEWKRKRKKVGQNRVYCLTLFMSQTKNLNTDASRFTRSKSLRNLLYSENCFSANLNFLTHFSC